MKKLQAGLQGYLVGDHPHGLGLVPNFLPEKEQTKIVTWTQEQLQCANKQKGRSWMWLGAPYERNPIPEWGLRIMDRLNELGIFEDPPNSILLNHYEPGVGNHAHVDEARYGSVIAGLSLGAPCVMRMRSVRKCTELLLRPGSLYVLQDEARDSWTHEIPTDTSGIFNGQEWERLKDRFSYTFRKVWEEYNPNGD